ncbi:ABC transporter ATP-binding protein [Nitratireductor sp. ZSWI3]|uniref:ABC transporter ATP-binding protein n=1 Tax=Nitratireductor sp. ZSWI3 TaxID=2966359 RepID=UPI00214FE716|nr:ABC transporter ATP-binding protein [Nitratireductor sp. ZSWI3]MCR4265274.1 ABC transporter ATP-binding protein [Nitratireductor sp. ZSWI3]
MNAQAHMPAAGAGNEVLLEIRNLDKHFDGLKAVSDVSMDLRAGIVTTLVGPNGAGKTTLFNLITGHLTRSGGSVRWLGRDIGGMKPYRVARLGIARTFQDLRLFGDMTVEENVLTVMEPGALPFSLSGPSTAEKRARVAEVLERTGLSAKARTRAVDLAYAERKFLSLARIMATRSRLWLLDEPASGLDPNSYELFLRLLREEVASGVTVCIIEHNLDIVVSISDRIAFLDRGRLLADGDPQTVLDDPDLAAIYFGDRT